MTALTLLPALLLTMTAFTRIIIVLAILRQALGTAQTPPNQVLIGLALFLTLFVMTPVIDRVNAGRRAALRRTESMAATRRSPGRPSRCATSCSPRPARRTWRCSPTSAGHRQLRRPGRGAVARC